jgi:hypothetical protein
MAGDYTRMTFRPKKDHSGVLMQQGRVTLDADWNELVELIDRRLRAETVDIVGRCIVPSETPDGFKIQVAGGALTIGRGRAYVHGLLAENHGGDPLEYDRVLGELRGTAPLSYVEQPYFPDTANVAPLPKSGTHVAYLDVWQREVTSLEDPDVVEKAVAVDTATRLQTAWQVRLLESPDGTTCDSQLPGWDALTAPSAGRLSTKAVGVPAADDPCTIPPAGGYRGTENRLYRVEIHNPGPLGTATFKWSRDNASIASAVTGIDAARKVLTLVRIGRDGVRRIRVDDWVEVTDDWRELNGLPGELRKVQDVDEVQQTITLASVLPAGAFDATDPARHARVRRWDQAGVAVDAAGGLMTTPATGPAAPIVLEDGVQIAFDSDPSGGDFHAGDYWVFAARTVDASVEELVTEPPHGVLHHYCRLAVVTFPDSVTDCRTLWPPPGEGDHGCDCTVCVTPESHASGVLTIQKAVDTVKATGGKVCLQVGVYRLAEPLRIAGARSLELQGRGWETILVSNGRQPAIIVQTSIGVEINDLTVVTATPRKEGASPAGIAVAALNTIGLGVERCVLLQLGAVRSGLSASGVAGSLAAAPELSMAGAPLIVLTGLVYGSVFRENVLLGTTGIGPIVATRGQETGIVSTSFLSGASVGVDGKLGRLLTYGLEIEDNLMLCWRAGVDLQGFSLQGGDTRIAGNSVYGCLLAGIVAGGVVLPGGRLDVVGNLVRALRVGIFAGTDDTRVVENDVGLFGGRGEGARSDSDGIVLGSGLHRRPIRRLQVLSNRVVGIVGDGISIRAGVASALVKQNVLEDIGGGGIIMTEDATAAEIAIENNQLLSIETRAGENGRGAYGIRVLHTSEAAVVGNVLVNVAQTAIGNPERVGIDVVDCDTIRIAGNDVDGVGPQDGFVKLGAGIAVRGSFGRADVCENAARRSRATPSKSDGAPWTGVLVDGGRPRISRLVVELEANPFSFSFVTGFARRLPRGRGSLGVRGNVLETYGDGWPATIGMTGACVFSENRCLRVVGGGGAAIVRAGAIIASGNYLEPGPGSLALELFPGNGPFTVLGNVGGPIQIGANPLGAPWDQLNR